MRRERRKSSRCPPTLPQRAQCSTSTVKTRFISSAHGSRRACGAAQRPPRPSRLARNGRPERADFPARGTIAARSSSSYVSGIRFGPGDELLVGPAGRDVEWAALRGVFLPSL